MNSRKHVLQLVPRFAPASCGVGEYAMLLAQEIRDHHGVDSSFQVADVNWLPGQNANGWAARRMKRGHLQGLIAEGESPPNAVILQYSGYGYAKRGAPLWLVRALQSFRRSFPQSGVITMFHEVAASGPPTTSAFWMRPWQLYVARRLARLSDVVLTNCEVNAGRLKGCVWHHMPPIIFPVFSNLGEAGAQVPLEYRERRIVVFSSNLAASVPLPSFWQDMAAAVARVGAVRVTMVGRPVEVPQGLGFGVEQTGFLTAAEASALLARSAFGYVFHGPLLLGKSGIFAAFAAHGMVPLIQTSLASLPDGLVSGHHYYPLSQTTPALPSSILAEMGAKIRAWYQPHNLAETSRAYAALIDRLRSQKTLA